MSFIAYEGPSMITSDPIIAVVTWNSENSKTGDMNQLWMLERNRSPWELVKTGKDQAVCGDCPLGGGRGCYVQVPQAPLSIWSSYHRGSYKHTWNTKQLGKRSIRLGAYGDPAAVPRQVIEDLVEASPGWTGFTHQWKVPKFRWLREYCMASTQSVEESLQAMHKGFRYFRVKPPDGEKIPLVESVCPASDEAGKKLQCEDCLFCSGTTGKGYANVVTNVHGMVYTKKLALRSVT